MLSLMYRQFPLDHSEYKTAPQAHVTRSTAAPRIRAPQSMHATMTRNHRTLIVIAAVLAGLALVLVLSAHRENSVQNLQPSLAGPALISNGPTLASAGSRWVSTECRVQVELTSDHGFWSIVDDGGSRSSVTGEWAPGHDSKTIIAHPGSDPGRLWVSVIRKIDGSTSARTFTAHITVETQSTTKELGSCTFALMQHGLGSAARQQDRKAAAPSSGD